MFVHRVSCAGEREVLDVRDVRLEGVTLRCWGAGRAGAPLLPAPATCALRLEHNLSDTHNGALLALLALLILHKAKSPKFIVNS